MGHNFNFPYKVKHNWNFRKTFRVIFLFKFWFGPCALLISMWLQHCRKDLTPWHTSSHLSPLPFTFPGPYNWRSNYIQRQLYIEQQHWHPFFENHPSKFCWCCAKHHSKWGPSRCSNRHAMRSNSIPCSFSEKLIVMLCSCSTWYSLSTLLVTDVNASEQISGKI